MSGGGEGEGGGGGDILLKLSKQSTWIQNKGAKNLLNKHGILLTENFDRALHFKISYLAIGEECRRLFFDM